MLLFPRLFLESDFVITDLRRKSIFPGFVRFERKTESGDDDDQEEVEGNNRHWHQQSKYIRETTSIRRNLLTRNKHIWMASEKELSCHARSWEDLAMIIILETSAKVSKKRRSPEKFFAASYQGSRRDRVWVINQWWLGLHLQPLLSWVASLIIVLCITIIFLQPRCHCM